uniref:Uncharacterized protein n=1 Tax=Rhizophora mucronata TaxID=61149 RepID=A0A2P2IKY4_RHIMU
MQTKRMKGHKVPTSLQDANIRVCWPKDYLKRIIMQPRHSGMTKQGSVLDFNSKTCKCLNYFRMVAPFSF